MDKFLTLKEYDRFSNLLLIKNNLPVTDHNVAFVNEMMMKADMKYDDNRTGGERKDFRFLYASYAIKTLKKKFMINSKKKGKNNFYFLYEDLPKVNSITSFMIDDILSYTVNHDLLESKDSLEKIKNSKIKDEEKVVCEKIMFDCDVLIDVAEEIGITKQNLNSILRRMEVKYPWIKEVLT